MNITDPIEKIIAQALTTAEIDFIHEGQPGAIKIDLDFYLPEFDIFIECKASHTDRVLKQLESRPNIILIQGMQAAKTFFKLLNGNISILKSKTV
jgi:hypothetical protein